MRELTLTEIEYVSGAGWVEDLQASAEQAIRDAGNWINSVINSAVGTPQTVPMPIPPAGLTEMWNTCIQAGGSPIINQYGATVGVTVARVGGTASISYGSQSLTCDLN